MTVPVYQGDEASVDDHRSGACECDRTRQYGRRCEYGEFLRRYSEWDRMAEVRGNLRREVTP
jgi:hypothetical protein